MINSTATHSVLEHGAKNNGAKTAPTRPPATTGSRLASGLALSRAIVGTTARSMTSPWAMTRFIT
jgi:hypothetical protein